MPFLSFVNIQQGGAGTKEQAIPDRAFFRFISLQLSKCWEHASGVHNSFKILHMSQVVRNLLKFEC